MSETTPQPRILTPKTLYNTVLSDGQTRLWIRLLCFFPDIKSTLCSSQGGLQKFYQRYRWLTFWAFVSAGTLIGLVFTGLFITKIPLRLFCTFSGTAVTILLICHHQKKTLLAQMAKRLVELDAEKIKQNTTLYEWGEGYAIKYKIPSLVDTIWLWDNLFRKAFLVLNVVLPAIAIYGPRLEKTQIILFVALATFLLSLTLFIVKSGLLLKMPFAKNNKKPSP